MMKAEITVEVDIQDVWDELDARQKMEFLISNLEDEGNINEILNNCFNKADIKDFVSSNLKEVEDIELIDELVYRGFVVTKED